MLVVFGLLANRTQNALSTLRDETWRTDKKSCRVQKYCLKTRRLNLSQDFCGFFCSELLNIRFSFNNNNLFVGCASYGANYFLSPVPACRPFLLRLPRRVVLYRRLARNLHTGPQNVRGEHLHPVALIFFNVGAIQETSTCRLKTINLHQCLRKSRS